MTNIAPAVSPLGIPAFSLATFAWEDVSGLDTANGVLPGPRLGATFERNASPRCRTRADVTCVAETLAKANIVLAPDKMACAFQWLETFQERADSQLFR
jgi:hypothetical protein